MMDWHLLAGGVAGILQLAGGVAYIVSMLRGTSRPNKVTQSLWLILIATQVSALVQAGPSWPLIMLSAALVNAFIIALLAFVGYGYTGHSTFDYACLVLAFLVGAIWQLTGSPQLAIGLSITVSVLAAAPAVYKTYRFPETESAAAWAVVAVAGILALVSTSRFDFANVAPALYQALENSTLTALAFFGQRRGRGQGRE